MTIIDMAVNPQSFCLSLSVFRDLDDVGRLLADVQQRVVIGLQHVLQVALAAQARQVA